jgi:hypothetical protein
VEDNEQHDISTADLYDKFKGIPASSRTVFLDSCFSGGMMRAISLGAKRHPFRMSRYFNRAGRVHPSVVIDVPVNEQDGSKDLMRVSKVSNPNNPNSGNADESIGPVCYFTATQGNEQAGEDEFNGQRHGVFTYYLTGVMDQIKERDAARMTWEELDTKVGAAVAKWMDDTQHPVVSHWYLDKGLFEGPHKPPPPPPPPSPSPVKHSVWDEYNTDHPDASRVTVAMKPDQTSVRVNVDKLHIVATARASGFLVILERGTSGSINLLFPNTRDASAARVNEDKVVDIPDKDSDFTPDSPGTERIKAILFSEERYCKELLEKFNADLKIPNITDASSTRDLSRVPHQSFYTSDIEFEAVTPDAGQNP